MSPPSSIASYKVVIADSNADTRTLIRDYMIRQHITVLEAKNKNDLWKHLGKENISCIIMDHSFPRGDALSVYNRIRASKPQVSIIMLAAAEEKDVGRIVGLEMGADDCISKPVNTRELLARIKSIFRRDKIIGEWARNQHMDPMRFGPYEINLKTYTLSKNGVKIPITSTQFSLLKIFVTNPNEWLSVKRLHFLLYDNDSSISGERIKTQVARIRKLIEENTKYPQYIKTARGKGYIFICPN